VSELPAAGHSRLEAPSSSRREGETTRIAQKKRGRSHPRRGRKRRSLRLAVFAPEAGRGIASLGRSDDIEVSYFAPSELAKKQWAPSDRFDAIVIDESQRPIENGLTRWLRKTCPDVPLISYGKPTPADSRSAYVLHLRELPAPGALRALVQDARRHLQSSRRASELTRKLRETSHRLHVLGGIVSTANSILEPRRVVNVIMAQIQELIPSEAWSILLVDEDTGELAFEMALGEKSSDLNDTRIKLGEGVAGWVAQTGEPAIVNDVRRDKRFQGKFDLLTRFRTRSILCAPLISRGRTIGVVEIMNRSAGRFTKKDMNLLLTLVEPAAIALENAILFQKTEQLAVTDDLTKLYNSRYLNGYLEQAIERARRSGSGLAVLFLDLDGFKSINDRHGHFYGSRTLREAGNLIRAAVREEDVVSRYGGDEFVVVLPDTDLPGALVVAERIRHALKTHDFLAEFGLSASLSASFGVAIYPTHGQNPQDLMQKADQAMYSVKERGKDAVCLASV
jgi:diguanylate cyclase (GGDEF)-like protein